VTLDAEGAASAVPSTVAAAALLVETCAALAVQAARRGDLEAARYLLEQALTAIGAHVRA
jgi:hypothetical protein